MCHCMTPVPCHAGVIIGLAIYNAHTLNISFPRAVYSKLLGSPLSLAHLADVEPAVHHSLTQLLAYPSQDVEEDMCLTFQVCWHPVWVVRKQDSHCFSLLDMGMLHLRSFSGCIPWRRRPSAHLRHVRRVAATCCSVQCCKS
jgi:HECT-domain (ubiquitin-transferase)